MREPLEGLMLNPFPREKGKGGDKKGKKKKVKKSKKK
jgi:hypothetical protein